MVEREIDCHQVAKRCPNTKIVVSGYSQGAQLVHTATQRLTAAQAARVTAGTSLPSDLRT